MLADMNSFNTKDCCELDVSCCCVLWLRMTDVLGCPEPVGSYKWQYILIATFSSSVWSVTGPVWHLLLPNTSLSSLVVNVLCVVGFVLWGLSASVCWEAWRWWHVCVMLGHLQSTYTSLFVTPAASAQTRTDSHSIQQRQPSKAAFDLSSGVSL